MALANAAVDRIDSGIADRALHYLAKDILDKQENREAVTIKVLEHIKDDPIDSAAKEPPSDDFFSIFLPPLRNEQVQKMLEHFALLLAGEIRRPGTFSFTTMHMVSLIDKQLAENIEFAASYGIMNTFIHQVGHLMAGENFHRPLSLNDIRFPQMGLFQNQFR